MTFFPSLQKQTEFYCMEEDNLEQTIV